MAVLVTSMFQLIIILVKCSRPVYCHYGYLLMEMQLLLMSIYLKCENNLTINKFVYVKKNSECIIFMH